MFIRYMDGWMEDNKICFLNSESTMLCAYNVENHKVIYKGFIAQDEKIWNIRKVIVYRDLIYLVSYVGDVIYKCVQKDVLYEGSLIYENKDFSEIRIEDVFVWKDCIYSVTNEKKGRILCYNLKTEKPEKEINLGEKLFNEEFITSYECNLVAVKLVDNTLYFTLLGDTGLYSYNLLNKKILCLKKFNEVIHGFDCVGDVFWIRVDVGFRMIKWQKGCHTYEKYELKNLSETEEKEKHGSVFCVKDKVIMLPFFSDTIAYFDKKDKEIRRIITDKRLEHREESKQACFSMGLFVYQDKLILAPLGTAQTIIVDMKKMNGTVYSSKIDDSVFEQYMSNLVDMGGLIYERKTRTLDMFLNVICSKN